MVLKDFLPGPALEAFVRCYRIVHFQFEEGQAIPSKPYTPRPENCLAFYPYDTERVTYAGSGREVRHLPVVLAGQHLGVTHRYIGRNFLVVQIIFQTGALYRLTGIPLTELNNAYMPAEFVFQREVHLINEQLFHAQDYAAMIRILNRFVLDLVKSNKHDPHPIDTVCQRMLRSDTVVSLDRLAHAACYSIRQFERNFKNRTGVNPKVFSRLIRFDQAFRTRNARPGLDWQRIAFECNYYDYQHLVRDYKDFTGYSPTAFHALGSPEESLGMSEQFYQTEKLFFSGDHNL
jgi:AraC-like DNA-binding protein